MHSLFSLLPLNAAAAARILYRSIFFFFFFFFLFVPFCFSLIDSVETIQMQQKIFDALKEGNESLKALQAVHFSATSFLFVFLICAANFLFA